MAVNPYNQTKPINVPIRPLTKGMFPDIDDPSIPKGGMQNIEGLWVTTNGIKSLPGITATSITIPAADAPIRELIFFKSRTAVHTELLIVGQENMYVYTESSGIATPIYLTWISGTVECPGTTTVTGTNTDWLTEGHIKAGDSFIFDPSGLNEEIEIASVNSDTQITLVSAPANSYSSGTSYEIRAKLLGDIDYAICPEFVAFADGVHPPFKYTYEATTLEFISTTTKDWIAATTTYAFDRLWFADLIEESTGYHYRQRIRWSSALDLTKFVDDVAGDVQWLDIPYSHSPIIKLLSLGILLVAYFRNTIYIGHRTNVTGNLLPYAFTEAIDTGQRGLVNKHAVADYLDSHFFVSQDDVYQLSTNQPLRRIGTQIAQSVVIGATHPEVFRLVSDPLNNQLVLSTPTLTGSTVADTYIYNLPTQAWSHVGVAWETFIAETFDLTNAALENYITIQDTVYKLDSTVNNTYTKIIQTPSLDFDVPDKVKTITRLSARLASSAISDYVFTVTGSTDKGITWKQLGTLTIKQNKAENYINFRLTGSTLVLKLSSTSSTLSQTLQEIVVRTYGRDLETHIR